MEGGMIQYMYSPFYIFQYSTQYPIFFGLLKNTQTNVKGDSCDNWFNMRSDPLFADTTFNILNSSSPAIGAASDGTNIGCYQGQGVEILYPRAGKNTVKSENTVQLMNGGHNCLYLSFPILKSELKMSVYKATGQCVFSRNIPKGQRLISLPFGLSSGVYVYTVHHVGKAATGKFIIH